MAANTAIEWATHTFNPWWGCTKVSDACRNCYADALSQRYGRAQWGPNGTRVRTSQGNWNQVLKWDRTARETGERPRVFCSSMADVFEGPETCAPDAYRVIEEARKELWDLIEKADSLTWLLLTKRPENILRFVPESWKGSFPAHVWPGTSIGVKKDEGKADELLKVPAAVAFLSCEPLVEAIRPRLTALPEWQGFDQDGSWQETEIPASSLSPRKIGWVICGGESGPGARLMRASWALSLRDQCLAEGVPFFFKQWGEYLPDQQNPKVGLDLDPDYFGGIRLGKKKAGRLLDGREWNEFPEVSR